MAEPVDAVDPGIDNRAVLAVIAQQSADERIVLVRQLAGWRRARRCRRHRHAGDGAAVIVEQCFARRRRDVDCRQVVRQLAQCQVRSNYTAAGRPACQRDAGVARAEKNVRLGHGYTVAAVRQLEPWPQAGVERGVANIALADPLPLPVEIQALVSYLRRLAVNLFQRIAGSIRRLPALPLRRVAQWAQHHEVAVEITDIHRGYAGIAIENVGQRCHGGQTLLPVAMPGGRVVRQLFYCRLQWLEQIERRQLHLAVGVGKYFLAGRQQHGAAFAKTEQANRQPDAGYQQAEQRAHHDLQRQGARRQSDRGVGHELVLGRERVIRQFSRSALSRLCSGIRLSGKIPICPLDKTPSHRRGKNVK